MPIITVYQHGLTSGTPPMRNDHKRAKRDKVKGWTSKTARSNTSFLRSVVLDDLSGNGLAFTLTIKECPLTHADWHKARKAFLMRLLRMGAIRYHWVTEWQRRGVPHLHGVAYFPEPISEESLNLRPAILEQWLKVASQYTCSIHAQNCKPISDSLGWLQYLAKHASRGAHHYQRSAANIPEGWKDTGRMWGKGGAWPIADPMKFELDKAGNFAYRRILRGYRKSQARFEGNLLGIVSARRMLKSNLRSLSEVRGTSAWIPEAVTMQILSHLAASGHAVTQ